MTSVVAINVGSNIPKYIQTTFLDSFPKTSITWPNGPSGVLSFEPDDASPDVAWMKPLTDAEITLLVTYQYPVERQRRQGEP